MRTGLIQKMIARDSIAGATSTGYVVEGSCKGKKPTIDDTLLSTSSQKERNEKPPLFGVCSLFSCMKNGHPPFCFLYFSMALNGWDP